MQDKETYGLGFAGAHRTGKTKLAGEFAKAVGIDFIQTSVTKVFHDLGYDPAKDYDLATRIMLQNAVLDDSIQKWDAQTTPFVTDRTPIDFIAYMLGSTHQEEITEALDEEIQGYMLRCTDAMIKYFDVIFELRPAIDVVFEVGKASITQTYIDKIALLISGLIATFESQEIPVWYPVVPEDMLDLDERVEFCVEYYEELVFLCSGSHPYPVRSGENEFM